MVWRRYVICGCLKYTLIRILFVRGRASRSAGGWTGCCGASGRGSFAALRPRCSWRFASPRLPLISCHLSSTCPTPLPSSSARAIPRDLLSFGWQLIVPPIACWFCWGRRPCLSPYHYPQPYSILISWSESSSSPPSPWSSLSWFWARPAFFWPNHLKHSP